MRLILILTAFSIYGVMILATGHAQAAKAMTAQQARQECEKQYPAITIRGPKRDAIIENCISEKMKH